eukprot:EG_transcript_30523
MCLTRPPALNGAGPSLDLSNITTDPRLCPLLASHCWGELGPWTSSGPLPGTDALCNRCPPPAADPQVATAGPPSPTTELRRVPSYSTVVQRLRQTSFRVRPHPALPLPASPTSPMASSEACPSSPLSSTDKTFHDY